MTSSKIKLGPIDRDTIGTAINMLKGAGFFNLLLEHTLITNSNRPSGITVDMAALRGSWMDGYLAAIDDSKNFIEKYILDANHRDQPIADFGAVEKLLDNKIIKSKDEL